jgi:hypothetical protein
VKCGKENGKILISLNAKWNILKGQGSQKGFPKKPLQQGTPIRQFVC